MAKNFPNLMKDLNFPARKSENLKKKNYKENHTQAPMVKKFHIRDKGKNLSISQRKRKTCIQKNNSNDLQFIRTKGQSTLKQHL